MQIFEAAALTFSNPDDSSHNGGSCSPNGQTNVDGTRAPFGAQKPEPSTHLRRNKWHK